MEKFEVREGVIYVCHDSDFSWFFIGKALSKKEKTVLVRMLKCHPEDHSLMKAKNFIINVAYSNIIEII